jgi:hypothetical protein
MGSAELFNNAPAILHAIRHKFNILSLAIPLSSSLPGRSQHTYGLVTVT